MKKLALTLLAALALATPAIAQVPQLPENTVFGRLGIGTGPGQAIPFATFSSSLAIQTPVHSLVIGKGAGQSGFNSVGPCAVTQFVAGAGASADPICRSLTATDLPNPSSTTLGGVFSLPVTSNSVLSGIGNDGTPTRATTTGSGNVVRAQSPTFDAAALSGSAAGNAINITQTWNTAGEPELIRAAVTDTSHGANSAFIALYGGTLGTTRRFFVSPLGEVVSGAVQVISTSSGALVAGRQGAVQPAFQVDSSNAAGITGISVAAQAAGNGVNITGIGEANVPLIINGAGTGTINFGTMSTGSINFFRTTNWHGSSSGLHTVQALAAAGAGTSTWPTTTGTIVNTGYYPNLRFVQSGINANSVADNSFTIAAPAGITRFRLAVIGIANTGTTASLTTAQYGVFSAAGGGGTAYVASGTALTALTATGTGSQGAFAAAPSTNFSTTIFTNPQTFFFRITQAQGAAATIEAQWVIEPLP